MPERWEDELKKLRREEMPDGVRERAEGGPRRDLPNGGRQRLVAGIVAFAVFIAAGAFAWRAFGSTTMGTEPTPSPDVSVVLDLSSQDGNPVASLSSGGVTQPGVREGYEWCGSVGDCRGETADFSSYPPVSDYLLVPAGAPVEVTGDGRVDGLKTLLPNGDRLLVPHRVDPPVIPSVPGRWVWVVHAAWDSGSATYYFGLQIVAPPKPSDPAGDQVVLDCESSSTTTIEVAGSVPPAEQDWDSVVADSVAAIPGLLPSDRVKGGPTSEGWSSEDGPHPVVIRDGSVIAALYFREFAASGGSWSFDLESCDGSGIGGA